MKDQLQTIRAALDDASVLNPYGSAFNASVRDKAKQALTALDQIEKMVGSQVPVAWGMQHTDGAILDVISPEEHAREEGGYVVPLYRAAPVAQQPKCVCGQQTSLGVVHRTDGPCFVYEAQQPQAEDDYKMWYEDVMRASNEAGFVGASAGEANASKFIEQCAEIVSERLSRKGEAGGQP